MALMGNCQEAHAEQPVEAGPCRLCVLPDQRYQSMNFLNVLVGPVPEAVLGQSWLRVG